MTGCYVLLETTRATCGPALRRLPAGQSIRRAWVSRLSVWDRAVSRGDLRGASGGLIGLHSTTWPRRCVVPACMLATGTCRPIGLSVVLRAPYRVWNVSRAR